jgi:hypothetical protein
MLQHSAAMQPNIDPTHTTSKASRRGPPTQRRKGLSTSNHISSSKRYSVQTTSHHQHHYQEASFTTTSSDSSYGHKTPADKHIDPDTSILSSMSMSTSTPSSDWVQHDLLIRNQHLTSLLKEAQTKVMEQAKEISVLKHAMVATAAEPETHFEAESSGWPFQKVILLSSHDKHNLT